MDKRTIAIALAPTGGDGPGNGNPVTPEEIAGQVIAAAAEGASVVHMHSRNRQGELTADRRFFDETVRMISHESDIVVEASTGGLSEMSAQERVLPTGNPVAKLGSLNIGSLNFGDQVYKNSLPDVRYWIKTMQSNGVKPSLEVFDTGHLETARYLINQNLVVPPFVFNFIFGVKWGMPFDPKLLDYLVDRLPEGSLWGATMIGSSGFADHLKAAQAGASIVRCGFEDSRSYSDKTAVDNPELVRALRAALEADGFKIAAPVEVTRALGVRRA